MSGADRTPLVSILIPTYNYARYVEHAVASAVAQTYPNLEVVVNDNCSTDGAWELLTARFGNEPRVHLAQNETNLGMGPNFDRVLERARGRYVMWLCSDDVLFPTHVERLMERFIADPVLDVVYANAYLATEEGVVYGERSMVGQFPVDYTDARDELVENFTTVCPVCLPCMLIDRAALGDRGIASAAGSSVIASDWELVIRFALEGKRFAYVAQPSMAIRVHDDQSSGDGYHLCGQNVLDFAVFVERYLDHPEFVRRMRGREVGIAKLLAFLVRDNAERNGGQSPLAAEHQRSIAALQERLVTRALAYEPARVRSSSITVVMETTAPPALTLRSLDALLEQRWDGWDLALVDHGPVRLEAALRSHPIWGRTSYVRIDTAQAPGHARNLALRMARGEYVAFLEPGNRFDPDHLARAVETVARDGGAAALAGTRLVLEHVNAFGIVQRMVGEVSPFGDAGDVAQLDVAPALPLDALVVYRGVFDRVDRFNATLPFFDEWDFLLRLARGTRIDATGAMTVLASARLGLVAQRIGERAHQLPAGLAAVHAAYPVDSAAEEDRRRFRERVAAMLPDVRTRTATAQGLAEFACTLAGRVLSTTGAG
jgi:glycosyltransferase involved in cell wall biosynthesis